MTLQSLRFIVRVLIPSSYKARNSTATPTQRLFFNNPTPIQSLKEHRFLSQKTTPISEELTVDFDYVKRATLNHGTLIIDVREPEEVKEHGKIPNSINIPLSNVVPVLSNLTENEFHEIYDRSKPKVDTEVIFYCMIGKRSAKAQQNALKLGFKNAKNYLGSWTDWATKTH